MSGIKARPEELPLSGIQLFGWSLVLLAWLWACAIGHGFELQRQAVVLPFLLAGTACCCLPGGARPVRSWRAAALLLAAGYFLARGYTSSVWDLARRDWVLVAAAILSIWSGSVALQNRRGRGMLLGVVVFLLLANLGAGLYQRFGDPSFSFLRGERQDQQGVSGIYFHRNYLAGFLELALPLIGASALVARSILWKLVCGLLLVLGCALAWATSSRAGFAACGVAVLVLAAVWLVATWRGASARKRGVLLALVAVLCASLAVVWLQSFKSLQLGRMGEEIGVEDFQTRLGLVGIGFDVWQQNPVWGNGARSYSYEVVRNPGMGDLRKRMGNPEMAHNEYIQVLADYGMAGLLAVLTVLSIVGTAVICGMGGASAGRGRWVFWALLAGLVASLLHALVDFNPHILPNLMLLALLAGGCLGMSRGRDEGRGLRGTVLALLLGAIPIWATGNEILGTAAWMRLERLRGDSRYEAMRTYAAKAPEFHLSRDIARITNERRLRAGRTEGAEALSAQSLADWQAVYARHRLDTETLVNLARAADWTGRFEDGERHFREAMEAAGARVDVYGLKALYSEHLRNWATALWEDRQPEKARYLYERSRAWLQAAWTGRKEGYRGMEREEYLEIRNWLDSRIRFFEATGVEAEEDSRVLDQEP